MKIISWNVNGIRAVERKGALRELIDIHQPDVLFFQEIKAKPEQLSTFGKKFGTEYVFFWNSAEKPGYSGTACWIRYDFLEKAGIKGLGEIDFEGKKDEFGNIEIKGLEFLTAFDGNPVANEGRIAQLNFDLNGFNYALIGLYFPNGGKSEEAWKGKMKFYAEFLIYVNKLKKSGKTVIWMGDVNAAHTEIDLARPKNNLKSIGFLPVEREWISSCVDAGWIDLWRAKNPSKIEVYSWWHVITRSREKNVGWRIDYVFVEKTIFDKIKSVEYLTNQMGSDHCPTFLEI